jgi:hypothetical protein
MPYRGAKMNQDEIEAALKALVEQTSCERVVVSLAQVCRDKAKHVRLNWQAEQQAQVWEGVAGLLDNVAEYIAV